jgi:hypothetical protein
MAAAAASDTNFITSLTKLRGTHWTSYFNSPFLAGFTLAAHWLATVQP